MSANIDERVVGMQFDNQQFQQGVQETITSLKELRQSIESNTKTTKFSNVLNVLKTGYGLVKDIYGFGKKIVTSTKNFATKLGSVVGATQLITSQISKMKETLAGVTFGGITAGFEEYELLTNSTKTIYANVKNSGKSLGDVTNALQELNKYADETIYKFGEMTRNIGYFTVAGVDLETSVAAIKGFSNLAAMQGVDASQTARATYQLSQAMSTGYVKLLDWRSLENASMAGKQFQDLLVQIAKKAGVKYDELLKKHKSFRETLSEGWLTTDIMLKALSIYSGDYGEGFLKTMTEYSRKSKDIYNMTEDNSFATLAYKDALAENYTKLKEYGVITGETNEQLKESFEEFRKRYKLEGDAYNVEAMKEYIAKKIALLPLEKRHDETVAHIAKEMGVTVDEAEKLYQLGIDANKAATQVPTFSKLIDTLKEEAQSGWTRSWQLIIGDLTEATSLWTGVKDELSSIISSAAESRNLMLESWKKDSELARFDEEGHVVGHKFFDAIANFYQGAKGIAEKIKAVFESVFPPLTDGKLKSATNSLYDMSVNFKNFVFGVDGAESGLSKLMPIFDGFGKVLSFVKGVIASFFSGAFNLVIGLLTGGELGSSIGKISLALGHMIQVITESGLVGKILNAIFSIMAPIIDGAATAISWVVDQISALIDLAKEVGILDAIGNVFSTIAGWAAPAINWLKQAAVSVWEWLNANVDLSAVANFISTAWTTISTAIGDFFTTVWDWVKDTSVYKALSSVVDWIGNLFSGNIDFTSIIDSIKNFFTSIWSTLSGLGVKTWNWLKSTATNVWDGIKGLFGVGDKMKEGKKSLVSGASSWISKTATTLFNFFTKTVPSALSNTWTWVKTKGAPAISKGFSSTWDWIKGAFNWGVNAAKDVWSFTKNKVVKPAWNGLKIGAKAVGNFFASIPGYLSKAWSWTTNTGLPGIISGIRAATNWLKELAPVTLAFGTALGEVITSMGIFKAGTGIKRFGTGVKGIGKGVQGIGDALKTFDLRSLGSSLADGLSFIGNGLSSLGKGIGKGLKGLTAYKKIQAIAKVIASIALLVGVIVGAIYVLGQITPAQYRNVETGLKYLGLILVSLTMMIAVITQLGMYSGDTKNISHIGRGILSMAAGLAVLVLSLKWLTKLLVDDNFINTLPEALSLLGALLFSLGMTARLAGEGKATGFIKMAIGLLGMIFVLKRVISLIKGEDDGDIWHAIGILSAMMLVIGGAIALSKLGGDSFTKGMTGVLGLCASLLVLVFSVSKLAKLIHTIGADDVGIAAGIIAGLAMIVPMFALLSTLSQGGKGAKNMIVLSVSLLILTSAVKSLATMMHEFGKPDEVLTATGVLAGLMAFLSIFSLFSGLTSGTKGAKNIIKMTVAIFILAKAVKGLAEVDQKSLVTAGLVVGGLLALMDAFVLINSLAKGNSKSTGSIVIMTAAILVLCTAIKQLSKLDRSNLSIASTAVGAIMAFIALMYLMMNGMHIRFGRWLGSILTLGVIVASMMVLTNQLKKLVALNSSGLRDAVISFGILIGEFVVAMGAFGLMGPWFAIKASLSIGIFVGAITALLYGFSWLSKNIEGFDEALGRGQKVFDRVGNAIGSFIGSLFSGFMAGSTRDLGEVGSNLSEFSKNVQPFMDDFMPTLQKFSVEDLSKLSTFATAIGSFNPATESFEGGGVYAQSGDASVVVGYMKTQTSTYSEYAEAVRDLLASIQDFMDAMSGYSLKQKISLDLAIINVRSLINAFNGLELPVGETGIGGAFAKTKDALVIFGYANIQRVNVGLFAEGVGILLKAYSEFISNEKITSIPADPNGPIKTHIDNVAKLISAVADIKMPEESSTAAGLFAKAGSSIAFLGYASIERVNADAVIKSISSLLDTYTAFVSSSVWSELTGDKQKVIDDNLQNVEDLVSAVASIEMPKVSNIASGLFALAGDTFSVLGYAKTERARVDLVIDSISRLLATYTSFVESDVIRNITGGELENVKTHMALVTGLVDAVSEIQLPEEEETSGGLFSWTGDMLNILGVSSKKKTPFGEMADGVSTLISEMSTFIQSTKDLSMKDMIVVRVELGALILFLKSISKIELPVTTLVANFGQRDEEITQIRESLGSFAGGVGLLLSGFSSFVTSIHEANLNDKTKADIEWALKELEDFLKGLAGYETTSIHVKTFDEYGNIIDTTKDSFNSFAGGVDTVLTSFGDFCEKMTTLNTTDKDKADITFALDELTTFLKSLERYETPSVFDFEYLGEYHSLVVSVNEIFALFALGVNTMLDGFTSFVTDMQTANPTEKTKADVEWALGQVKSLLESLSGFKTPSIISSTWGLSQASIHVFSVNSTFSSFAKGVDILLNSFDGFIKKIGDLGLEEGQKSEIEFALNQFIKLMDSLDTFTPPKEWTFSWAEGITSYEKFDEFVANIGKMGEAIGAFYGGLGKNIDKITDLHKGLVEADSGFDNTRVVSFFSDFLGMVVDIRTLAGLVDSMGTAILFDDNMIANVFKAVGSFVSATAEAINEKGINGLLDEVNYSGLAEIGSALLEYMSEGINESSAGYAKLNAAFDGIIAPAVTAVKGSQPRFVEAGRMLAAGLASGIASGRGQVVSASLTIVNAAAGAIESFAQIQSPSKLTMSLGEYFSLGFANGITNETSMVSNAATGIAETAYTDMANTFVNLSSMLEAAMNTTPTIRPVMDLSDVNAGFSAIDSMALANRSINLATARNNAIAAAQSANNTQIQNGRVSAIVDAINNKVSELSDNIQNLQLVMDTGIVAGQLAPRLNRRLGSMIDSARRRNAT